MARWLAVTAADFRPRTVSGFGCSLARNFESIRRIGITAVDVPQFFEHRRKGIEVFGYLGEMFPTIPPDALFQRISSRSMRIWRDCDILFRLRDTPCSPDEDRQRF